MDVRRRLQDDLLLREADAFAIYYLRNSAGVCAALVLLVSMKAFLFSCVLRFAGYDRPVHPTASLGLPQEHTEEEEGGDAVSYLKMSKEL